jgi:hypothetical protein
LKVIQADLQISGGQSLYFVFEKVSQKPNTTIKNRPTIIGMRTILSVDGLYVVKIIQQASKQRQE